MIITTIIVFHRFEENKNLNELEMTLMAAKSQLRNINFIIEMSRAPPR
jgi:hypothetical protein